MIAEGSEIGLEEALNATTLGGGGGDHIYIYIYIWGGVAFRLFWGAPLSFLFFLGGISGKATLLIGSMIRDPFLPWSTLSILDLCPATLSKFCWAPEDSTPKWLQLILRGFSTPTGFQTPLACLFLGGYFCWHADLATWMGVPEPKLWPMRGAKTEVFVSFIVGRKTIRGF